MEGDYSTPLGTLRIAALGTGTLVSFSGGPGPRPVLRFDAAGRFVRFEVVTSGGPGPAMRGAVGCSHLSPAYRGPLYVERDGMMLVLSCPACTRMVWLVALEDPIEVFDVETATALMEACEVVHVEARP